MLVIKVDPSIFVPNISSVMTFSCHSAFLEAWKPQGSHSCRVSRNYRPEGAREGKCHAFTEFELATWHSSQPCDAFHLFMNYVTALFGCKIKLTLI
jgi:hypothetical protein